MLGNLGDSLAKLKGSSVRVLETDAYPEVGKATAQLVFSEGTKLRIDYWRFVRGGKRRLSSFDHKQQYGLPAPIDAIKELQGDLHGKIVTGAQLDRETRDLHLQFTEDLKLQVFGFSAYEVWEISFPDGTAEYSNGGKWPA